MRILALLSFVVLSTHNAAVNGAVLRALSPAPVPAPAPSPGPSGSVTPISKVIELLHLLRKQLFEDGEADARAYVEFRSWYRNDSTTSSNIIDDAQQSLSDMQSGIKSQEAVQATNNRKLSLVISEISSKEAELKDATDVREKEQKTFTDNERSLMEGIDSLERSIVVLGKQMPQQKDGASLLSIADTLRDTFDGPDFKLTAGQRETLNDFVRVANSRGRFSLRHVSMAPAFVQISSGPGEEYESQGGGVVSTLKAVLKKSEDQLKEARNQEAASLQAFNDLSEKFKTIIEAKKKAMAEIKTVLSQSKEEEGKMKSRINPLEDLIQSTNESLNAINKDFSLKTSTYKAHTARRSDEVLAVTEAIQILNSDAAKRLLKLTQMPKVSLPPSLLQVARRAANSVRNVAPTVGFALLALRSDTQSVHRSDADPFRKVKSMIRNMVAKLKDEQAKEATHKQYCDSEMAHSTKTQHEKKQQVQKLTDRVGAIEAELETLTSDIQTITKQLHEMDESTRVAAKIRASDHTRAINAIQQYKDAQKLIKAATNALVKFYGKKQDGTTTTTTLAPGVETREEAKQRDDLAGGVVGILEIALSDYADMQKETEEAEATAAQEYKELMIQSDIKMVKFKKDLEYKNRDKLKLERDNLHERDDLRTYKEELSAVQKYLAELRKECVAKAETYGERKARRETEIASLKEALEHLSAAGP